MDGPVNDAYEADRSTENVSERKTILIEDMSNVAQNPAAGSPLVQQLQWHENARDRTAQEIASTRSDLRRVREERDLDEYFQTREQRNKAQAMESMVVQLTRELEQLTRELNDHQRHVAALKAQIREQDASLRSMDQRNAELQAKNLQQAATIKHQSQLIQNPGSMLATPSHGHDSTALANASYTRPPPKFSLPDNTGVNASFHSTHGPRLQSFGNASVNNQYLNPAERGSPGFRSVRSPPNDDSLSRNSSHGSHPYPSMPKLYPTSSSNRPPTTSSTRAIPVSDNSMALVAAREGAVTSGTDDLSKGFEHVYDMVETFARAHVNFVSSEKDGNMPQAVKEALLSAAAPANAFPFMAKPESRYHMVAKVMVIWINKEVLQGISFASFNAQVAEVIATTKQKVFQGTPFVIKAMYMTDIANHVRGLQNAQGYQEWFQQLCRHQGNELWKLVKPMMHQKTANDWQDMYALMFNCHMLAIEAMLSNKEIVFESVDIQARFDPGNMINRDRTMMGMRGEDLVRRGAVVRLEITPKVLVRSYTTTGNSCLGLVYPATVLVKWADVRQDFSVHRRN